MAECITREARRGFAAPAARARAALRQVGCHLPSAPHGSLHRLDMQRVRDVVDQGDGSFTAPTEKKAVGKGVNKTSCSAVAFLFFGLVFFVRAYTACALSI